MAHKEKIDYLLLDIRELEQKIAGMRDAEIYPVTFFSQSFQLAHKILTDLHRLEENQLEELSRQIEEHRLSLASIPFQKAAEQPVITYDTEVEEEKYPEQPEEKEVSIPVEATPVYEELKKDVSVPKEALGDKKASASLNEILEKKNLSDFRKAFSLNDRFRFRRDLFSGNEERMNQTINELNNIRSYEDSVSYLHNELLWDMEDEAVVDFLKLIEKRFL